jgi:hypothetical protein
MMKITTSDKNYDEWQVSQLFTRTNINQATSWLMCSWSTFVAQMNHGHTQIHKTHHDLNLGEAITFPLIVFSMINHNNNIHNVILSILRLGFLAFSRAITSFVNFRLRWSLKQSHINKLNTTIHSIMIFTVITYNQNLHFIIHYKNYRNNIIIHFIIIWHYKKFTQRNEHKIHHRSLCFSILLKSWIQITTKSHVLLKKIPKLHLKFVLYQNTIYGFLLHISSSSYSSPKLPCFIFLFPPLYFLELSPFELYQVTSSWSKQ